MAKDLKKLIGKNKPDPSSSSAFSKKWSIATSSEWEDDDTKAKQLLVAINNTLDDFKYPDRVVWNKNSQNSSFNNIWKSNIIHKTSSEIFITTLTRIIAMMKTCEKFIRLAPKTKKEKSALSSNRTISDHHDSRNDWLSSYMTSCQDYYTSNQFIYSPNRTKFENYTLKTKGKKSRSKKRNKNTGKKDIRSRMAPNSHLNSLQFSKSLTEVNSIEDPEKFLRKKSESGIINKVEKAPSTLWVKVSLKKMQQKKNSKGRKPVNYL